MASLQVNTNRLSKVLAAAGIASRRACEELIFEGHVTVNGEVVLVPQTQVTLGVDKIQVAGKTIKSIERKVYYILNKPAGYLCSSKSEFGKIVLDLFPDEKERLFTVGRLDKDTTGLLIVTNDGHFANEVIHPSANIQKEYLVKTYQEITDDHLKAAAKGCFIEGVHVKPVRITKVRRGTLRVVLLEGKKREVRVLLESVGLEVEQLTRIRIGKLLLGTLPLGAYRELTDREREMIFE